MGIFVIYGFIIIIRTNNLNSQIAIIILSNSIFPQFLIALPFSLIVFGIFGIIIIYKYKFIGFIIWNLVLNLFDGVTFTQNNTNRVDSITLWSPGGQIEHDILLIISLIILARYKLIYSGKRILIILIYVAFINYPVFSLNPIISISNGTINEIISQILVIILCLAIVNFKNLNEFMKVNING